MKLTTAPFAKIASSSKVIESWLYDEKRQQINLGDQLEFTSNSDQSKKVIAIVKATITILILNVSSQIFLRPYLAGLQKKS